MGSWVRLELREEVYLLVLPGIESRPFGRQAGSLVSMLTTLSWFPINNNNNNNNNRFTGQAVVDG
jgi:hypothetical protein